MGVGNPSGRGKLKNCRIIANASIGSVAATAVKKVNLRPVEHVDGARGGFVAEQLHVGNGLRHLEGVLLPLHALLLLLLLRQLEHHHHRVGQVLKRARKMG